MQHGWAHPKSDLRCEYLHLESGLIAFEKYGHIARSFIAIRL